MKFLREIVLVFAIALVLVEAGPVKHYKRGRQEAVGSAPANNTVNIVDPSAPSVSAVTPELVPAVVDPNPTVATTPIAPVTANPNATTTTPKPDEDSSEEEDEDEEGEEDNEEDDIDQRPPGPGPVPHGHGGPPPPQGGPPPASFEGQHDSNEESHESEEEEEDRRRNLVTYIPGYLSNHGELLVPIDAVLDRVDGEVKYEVIDDPFISQDELPEAPIIEDDTVSVNKAPVESNIPNVNSVPNPISSSVSSSAGGVSGGVEETVNSVLKSSSNSTLSTTPSPSPANSTAVPVDKDKSPEVEDEDDDEDENESEEVTNDESENIVKEMQNHVVGILGHQKEIEKVPIPVATRYFPYDSDESDGYYYERVYY